MKVSVIIPVYNVEAYLKECLDSVIAQTESDWEAIIIDDASADGSLLIAEVYAARDPRFRILRQSSNRGPSATRNMGLDAAQGDYITFLDSDDLMHPCFIEWMIKGLEDNDADISSCAFEEFDIGSEIKYRKKSPAFQCVLPSDAINRILFQKRSYHCSLYAKIYRRSLWKDVRLRHGIIYEDLDIFYRVYERSRLTAHTSAPLYLYRCNPASITHVFTPRRADVLDVTARIEDWASTEHPEFLAAARSRSLSAAFNILLLMRKNNYDAPALSARCRAIIRGRRKECLFGKHIRPRNRLASLATYFWKGF